MGLVQTNRPADQKGPDSPAQTAADLDRVAKTVLSAHGLKQLDTRTHTHGLDARHTPVTDDGSMDRA